MREIWMSFLLPVYYCPCNIVPANNLWFFFWSFWDQASWNRRFWMGCYGIKLLGSTSRFLSIVSRILLWRRAPRTDTHTLTYLVWLSHVDHLWDINFIKLTLSRTAVYVNSDTAGWDRRRWKMELFLGNIINSHQYILIKHFPYKPLVSVFPLKAEDG